MSLCKRENSSITAEDPFQIKPDFIPPNINANNFNAYLRLMEEIVKEILPQDLSKGDISNKLFIDIYNQLPIINCSNIEKSPTTLAFTILSMGKYIHGIGRFIADMLSRWLIPGKQLSIDGDRSLMFKFKKCDNYSLFLCEFFIQIEEEKELLAIKKNLPSFIQEMRINILAVHHSRAIMAMKKLSFEEKSTIIQENISSLLERASKGVDVFDQMQDFLFKISAEKKLSQIKENIAYLMKKRPQIFDRDMFDAMYNVSLLFKGKFVLLRNPNQISRIIGFQYLFKKIIEEALRNNSKERHLSFKIIKINSQVVGILSVFNFTNDMERFEKNHMRQTVKACLNQANCIEDSFIIDKSDDKIRCFYLEIEKIDKSSFSKEEIKLLKMTFPKELKDRIENIMSPIFMPQNDEEIFRNIILLSKQLKYVRDIPQVIISYEKQTPKELSFNLILVRLIKADSLPLKELFSYSQTFLKFKNEEVKIIGSLKKKYPKEVTIFKLSLDKEPFFRKDFTLDLQKARQVLVEELTKIIGQFRDFNGGLILKQQEVLNKLKFSLASKEKSSDFLIENFFYSIYPSSMTGILGVEVLEKLFLLMQKVLKKDFSTNRFLVETLTLGKCFLIMIGADLPNLKERLYFTINKLNIPSFDLISSTIETDSITTIGYIYKTNEQSKIDLFQNTIYSFLENFYASFNNSLFGSN